MAITEEEKQIEKQEKQSLQKSKTAEGYLEAAPQLLLQSYILWKTPRECMLQLASKGSSK